MTFRWWMAPVIGVGLAAIANGVLITTALRVRPQKSEARPYAASAEEDARAGERAAFAERGWKLDSTVDGSGMTLSLHAPRGPGPRVALVRLFRPDDAGADLEVAWSDPARPLRVPLPRPGSWSVRVAIRDALDATLACEARVNRP